MHKGSYSPYQLDARVYMGLFTYGDWIRQSYTISAAGFTLWTGSDAGLITANPPYTSYRQASLEASLNELAIAAYVQQLHGQDLYVGWLLQIQPDQHSCLMSDQVWLGGAMTMDLANDTYIPTNLTNWSSSGHPHTLLPGATIGCLPLNFAAVPY
jgi:hypothetical protein